MQEARGYRSVSPSEAQKLVTEGAVRVIDVRTEEEYAGLGHIPGAVLLPVDLIAVAPATLPREGPPLLVCCEHGVRSVHAARLLEAAGFPDVLNMSGGMSRWSGARDFTHGTPFGPTGPSSWLVACARLLPRGGRVLDVACGLGRHSLLMASAGYRVVALDRDSGKIEALRLDAQRLGLPVEAAVMDLEAAGVDLGKDLYEVILVFHYLHRPLFPAIRAALAPGGLLLYETFTTAQAQRGHPTNPDFLLEPGELERLVAPLPVLDSREGEFEARMVASVAARREG